MSEEKSKTSIKKVDTKEFELPETVFVRDIENHLLQEIILQCLNQIQEIAPVEGNLIENLFGRSSGESLKGIYAEQDNKNHSVLIKVEVNIAYGVSIPEKAEEIQTLIAEEVTRLTGLHVSSVHVVFKSILSKQNEQKLSINHSKMPVNTLVEQNITEEYSDEF